MQETQELPNMTFELRKVREEKGRTFSEEGIATFMIGVNEWLREILYKTFKEEFERGKAVKKIRMKMEFLEIISDN